MFSSIGLKAGIFGVVILIFVALGAYASHESARADREAQRAGLAQEVAKAQASLREEQERQHAAVVAGLEKDRDDAVVRASRSEKTRVEIRTVTNSKDCTSSAPMRALLRGMHSRGSGSLPGQAGGSGVPTEVQTPAGSP